MKSNSHNTFRTSIRLSFLDLKIMDEMLDSGDYRGTGDLLSKALDDYVYVAEKIKSGLALHAQSKTSGTEVIVDLRRYSEPGGGDLSGASIRNIQVTLKQRFKDQALHEKRSVSDLIRSALAVSSVLNSYAKDNYELLFRANDFGYAQEESAVPVGFNTRHNVITLEKLAQPIEKIQRVCDEALCQGSFLSDLGLTSAVVYLADPALRGEFRLVAMKGVKFTEMMHGSISQSRRRNLKTLGKENYNSNPSDKKRSVRPNTEHRDFLTGIARDVKGFGDFTEREGVSSSAVFLGRPDGARIKSIVFFNFAEPIDFDSADEGEPTKQALRDVHANISALSEASLRQLLVEREDSAIMDALHDVDNEWSLKNDSVFMPSMIPGASKYGIRDLFETLLKSVCMPFESGPSGEKNKVIGYIDWLDRGDGLTLYRAAHYSNLSKSFTEQWGVHELGNSPLSTLDWTITHHGALYLENIEKSNFFEYAKRTLGNKFDIFSNGQLISIPMSWFGMSHGVMTIAVNGYCPELRSAVKLLNSIGVNFCHRHQQHIALRAAYQRENDPNRRLARVSIVKSELDSVVSATMSSVGKPSFDIWLVDDDTSRQLSFSMNFNLERKNNEVKPRELGWTYEVATKKVWIIVTGFRDSNGNINVDAQKVYQRELNSFDWSERDSNVDGKFTSISGALNLDQYENIGTVMGLPILDDLNETIAVVWIDINAEYENTGDLPSSYATYSLQLWADSVKAYFSEDKLPIQLSAS